MEGEKYCVKINHLINALLAETYLDASIGIGRYDASSSVHALSASPVRDSSIKSISQSSSSGVPVTSSWLSDDDSSNGLGLLKEFDNFSPFKYVYYGICEIKIIFIVLLSTCW